MTISTASIVLFSCGNTSRLSAEEGQKILEEIALATAKEDYKFPEEFSYSTETFVEGKGGAQKDLIVYSKRNLFIEHNSPNGICCLYADGLNLIEANTAKKTYSITAYETKEDLETAFNAYTSPFLLDYSAPIIASLNEDFVFADYENKSEGRHVPYPVLTIKSKGEGFLSVDARKQDSRGVVFKTVFVIENNLLLAYTEFEGDSFTAVALNYENVILHYPDLGKFKLNA